MDDQAKAENVNALLRNANLYRMRGNAEAAMEACREALALDSENAAAHDLLGDLLLASGQLEPAMEQFRSAFAHDPRPATEEKIARLVLRLNEAKWRGEPDPASPSATKRRLNPSLACALSVLFPGLGQLYNGEYPKGFALLGAGLFFFFATAFLATPHLRALRALVAPTSRMGGGDSVPGAVWVFGLLFFLIWVYSLVDASLVAAAINRGQGPGGEKSGWEV